MNRRSIAIFSISVLAIASASLFFVLNLTNPSSGGPAGILLILFLVYALSFAIISLVALMVDYVFRLVVPRKASATAEIKLKRFYRKLVIICAVLSAMPIFLIALNSIGQLRFIDIVLIMITESVAIFYAVYRV